MARKRVGPAKCLVSLAQLKMEKYMEETGLSLYRIALAANLSVSQMGKYYHGVSEEPTLKAAAAISTATGNAVPMRSWLIRANEGEAHE